MLLLAELEEMLEDDNAEEDIAVPTPAVCEGAAVTFVPSATTAFIAAVTLLANGVDL